MAVLYLETQALKPSTLGSRAQSQGLAAITKVPAEGWLPLGFPKSSLQRRWWRSKKIRSPIAS